MKKFLLSAGLIVACGSMMAQVDASGVKPAKDDAVYADVVLAEGVTATLTNDWIYSKVKDNYPFVGDTRSLAYSKGKVYMPDRANGLAYLHVYNAATGEYIERVELPEQVAKKGNGTDNAFFPVNSIAVDSKGRLVVANLSLDLQGGADNGHLLVWVLEDEHDKNPVKLIDFTVDMETPGQKFRVDCINVLGDMKGEGYVFAGIASSVEASFVRWDIVDGKFTLEGEGKDFLVPDFESNPTIAKIKAEDYIGSPAVAAPVSLGTAPFIYPIKKDLIWVDGHSTYPTLYDMNPTLKDGFYDEGKIGLSTIAPSTGANGIADFELGGYHFLAVGKNNHGGEDADKNKFILYHQTGESVSPDGISIAVSDFPAAGMGKEVNGSGVVLPVVNVVDSETAEIYVFAMPNGFAKYTLKIKGGSSNTEIEAVPVTVVVDGNSVVVSEEVATIEVYSVTGQKVAAVSATDKVEGLTAGLYVVKTTDNAGVATSHKVIVK